MEYYKQLMVSAKRNERIRQMYRTGRYTMQAIAARFDMSKQRVSKIVKNGEK